MIVDYAGQHGTLLIISLCVLMLAYVSRRDPWALCSPLPGLVGISFTKEPQSLVVVPGDEVVFTCGVNLYADNLT